MLDPEHSPTLTLGVTRVGVILGTAAYMSPERPAAKRWIGVPTSGDSARCCMMMLSGKRAFAGESVSDTLASVLKLDPDWKALPAETPASIRRLIQRCLTKDRKQRLQAIGFHKSKGLTADLVVVVGCIEGLIPFIDSDLPQPDRDRSLEEQRRLFYVAITRPRQTLVLSSATHLPRDLVYRMRVAVRGRSGAHVNTIASRFLTELGPTRPRAIAGEAII
jgi:superfamily I DNA/RNA helicase